MFKLKRKQYVEQAKKELYSDKQITEWDPTGHIPDLEDIKEKNTNNHAKYLFIKNNPKHIKNVFLKLGAATIILPLITGLIGLIGLATFFFFALIITMMIYHFYLQSIKIDIIKLEIAKQNNYLYWPTPNTELWRKYVALYPEIFSRGEKRQNLEDIFWGTIKKQNNTHHFTTGLFNYTTTTRDNKGNSRDVKHIMHYFIIKLPTKISSRFHLYPENVISKITNFFTNKKIHTESIKFNKTFAFSYRGKKHEKQLDITQILTPRIQEELINMNEHKKQNLNFFQRKFNNGISVLFTNQEVIFLAPGRLINKIKTNFSKHSEIQEEDKQNITQELTKMIDISTEITKYLE